MFVSGSMPMIITVVVLLGTIFLFIQGKLRSDLIALCALLSLLLFGVLTPSEAFTGFANPVIFIIASMFVVSGGIVRSGLANVISGSILKLAGNNIRMLFVLTMFITAVIGALVSNTGTVAIMMPIVGSMALSSNVSAGRFLMPLAFMSGLGGMLTLIGNPPNMIVNEIYVKAGFQSLKLFSFLPIGIICIIFGMFILVPVTYFLLSKRAGGEGEGQTRNELHMLADKYSLQKNMYQLEVPEISSIIDKSLMALKLTTTYGITVQDIRRKKKQVVPEPITVIYPGDELYVLGEHDEVLSMVDDFKLKLIDIQDAYRFDSIGLSELVIMSSSSLVNSTIGSARLREQYGVTVLGIQRGNQYILHNLKDQVLQSGDALLVQGEWSDIAHLDDTMQNWVVVGRPLEQAANLLKHKIPYVVTILVIMIAVMAMGVLPTVTTALLAGTAMIAVGCFRNMREVYSFINWETLIMIACMLPLSTAMDKTGIVAFLGKYMSVVGTNYGPHVALAAVYMVTSLLNAVISFTPLTLLVAPIALRIALDLGVDPLPFMFAVATSAGLCFGSSFSTPSNAMVVSAGRYTFMDYLKIGMPLQLVLGVILIIAIPVLFPF